MLSPDHHIYHSVTIGGVPSKMDTESWFMKVVLQVGVNLSANPNRSQAMWDADFFGILHLFEDASQSGTDSIEFISRCEQLLFWRL